ncbi:MAG: archaeal heat shock protein Hsp20 [Promethearchaeota archaeon]|jgi:HSP20 family protein
MPKDDNYDDEENEDDEENPFDFFKYFGDPNKIFSDPSKFAVDPNKLFSSKQFRRIFKDIMNQISKNLPSEFQNLSPEELRREFMKNKSKFFKGPFMYGFNINLGKDGKPTIDSFGNIKTKPFSGKPEVQKAREPLTEVSDEGSQIVVICEMPGVTKEDIELKAATHSITISTKTTEKGWNYYKEVELPTAINSDFANARYVNGILEVRLKKIDEKHTNIKIE